MLHPLLNHFSTLQKPYRLLLWIALSALCTLQLCHYLYSQQQQALLNNSVEQYGERIAKLTADQVISSILNNDAISLQAVAQNIHSRSIASSVVIYNISNDILAQTNPSHHAAANDIRHHTAPVVSNNNIIGSVTIGISAASLTTPSDRPISLTLTLLLLIAMGCFYIKGRQSHHKEVASNTQIKDDLHVSPESTPSTIDTNINTFFLTLKIHNINQLYQQLNAELRQQQLLILEQHISDAINLYGGKKHVINYDSVTLSFEKTEDILNTLFSAELILQLNTQTQDSIIILSALIQHQNTDDTLYHSLDCARKSFSITTPQHGLFINAALSNNEQLNSRVVLDTCESPKIFRIASLTQSYQKLLDKQLQKLQLES